MYDIDNYLDQYQNLLNQARLWSQNKKKPTDLLVGEERKKAEIWLKQGFEVQDSLPKPQPLHYQFIEESYRQDFYDVFISYEVKNLELAIELQGELINNGFRVWCKHNLSNDNNNYDELIQRSDNIIFLVDQKFIDSQKVTQDLQITTRYNKHIIAILLEDKIKTDFCTKTIIYKANNREKLINNLKKLILNNKNYLRIHSYFLVKALEWEWHSKPISSLLIGEELTQAETWLEQSQEKSTPCEPLEIHREYIQESFNSSQAFFDGFISYGRADSLAFVARVYEELTRKGYRIWFDMQEIPYAVNYQKQIDNGIERAKNFIFFMAPHSVNSPYCRQEIDLAVKYKKRLIPVLHVPEIDEQTWKQRYPHKDWETAKQKGEHTSDNRNPNLHPALNYPNWIRYSDEQNFEQLIDGLETLFKTQSDYITQHTYILDKALEWERHQKQTEYLLIGEERQQAEKWLLTEFKNQQPPCEPSLLHCEYITQSKKNASNLMTQVFICGATEDNSFKEKITHSLMRKGFTVWTDNSDLRVGESLEEGIKRGIDEADTILYLLSLNGVNSSDCQKQLEQARSHHKRIFILLIEKLQDFPSENLIDFTDSETYEDNLPRLIKGLNEDGSYYERHKLLLTKALKWKQQPDNTSLLLRGYNLREAETWLKQARSKTQYSAIPEQEEFINASLSQPLGGSLDVFISYSRADSDFARKLNDELQMRGKMTWFDQESIATGVDFGQEIKRGIETSDNFVFIISPRSVKSPYCGDEVNYAKHLNKRIIPVLHRPVSQQDLEISGLGEIQWINFYQSEKDFNDLVSQLVRTIDTDRDHLHTHTELSLKALEWEAKKRDLLSETELLSAKQWLEIADSYKKQPYPTELQRRFITESGKAIEANRRKEKQQIRTLRLLLAGMSVAFLAAVGVSILALNLRREAQVLQASAIGRYGAISFDQNQQLNALKEVLPGARELQKLGATDMWMLAALQKIVYNIKEHNQLVHQARVKSVTFSPDGNTIASVSDDDSVNLWNLQGKSLSTFSHKSVINYISFSPDGKMIASASDDNTVKLWNSSGKLLSTLPLNNPADHVSFSADGKTIASSSGNTINLWNQQGQLLKILSDNHRVNDITFNSDGQIVSASGNTVKIWNQEGKLLRTLTDNNEIYLVTLSPDGQTIASVSANNVKLWNQDGKLLKKLPLSNDWLRYITFSPDSKTIAFASDDKTIQLWTKEGKLLQSFKNNSSIQHFTFSPDSKIIASANSDKTVTLWNTNGKLASTLYHDNIVNYVAFSPDGITLASASEDRTVKLWNLAQKSSLSLHHDNRISNIAFSVHNNLIASASRDQTVKLWNREGKLLQTLAHNSVVYHVTFSPDGKIIASASADNGVKLWSQEGKLLTTLPHQSLVYDVTFSPDGNTIASGSEDKTVKLWNKDGKLLKTLNHNNYVYLVRFSPDGQTLISVDGDNKVNLWSKDGNLLTTLAHKTQVYSVAFSPDSQIIATGSHDKEVKLWNKQGKLLKSLPHDAEVNYVVFSSDGKMIASASTDQTVKLWNREGILMSVLAHDAEVNYIAFSPDGQTIATASDNIVRLWSQKGKLLSILPHQNRVNQIAFSSDGKTIAVVSGDQVSLWDYNLDSLTAKACEWGRDYLANSANVRDEERKLCDGVIAKD